MASSPGATEAISLQNLPAEALRLVAQNLDISDRKSLALTCSAMPPIMRPLWTAVLVDITSKDAPPLSLLQFSGVTSILVVDSILSASLNHSYSNSSLIWDIYDPECYKQPTKMMQDYGDQALGRLAKAISLIRSVVDRDNSAMARRLKKLLIEMAVPATNTPRLLQLILQDNWLQCNSSKVMESPSQAMATLPTYINGFESLRALPAAATSFDAGWFIPDGSHVDIVQLASVSWTTAPETFQLGKYTNLRALRLSVTCSETEGLTSAFQSVALQLNALENLERLAIIRPCNLPDRVHLDVRQLQLSKLTFLTITGIYASGPLFSSFTHLSNLRELVIYMPETVEDPEGVAGLASMSALRTLAIENYYVSEPQNMSALTQITDLAFDNVRGPHFYSMKPASPMPNLEEFSFLYSFHHYHAFAPDYEGLIDWPINQFLAAFPAAKKLSFRVDNVLEQYSMATLPEAVAKTSEQIQSLISNNTVLKELTIYEGSWGDNGLLVEKVKSGELNRIFSTLKENEVVLKDDNGKLSF